MRDTNLVNALREHADWWENGDMMEPLGGLEKDLAEAADLIEKLTARCARYAEEIAVAQERTRWIPVAERLPEVWRNDETAELVNYMIYSPYFGVDIGNYHAEAKTWLCMALPCTVTHWMPLPEGPEEVE